MLGKASDDMSITSLWHFSFVAPHRIRNKETLNVYSQFLKLVLKVSVAGSSEWHCRSPDRSCESARSYVRRFCIIVSGPSTSLRKRMLTRFHISRFPTVRSSQTTHTIISQSGLPESGCKRQAIWSPMRPTLHFCIFYLRAP